ncbi:G5 domain-containing protein [Streptococcus oralis]|uniref:G5 domain-containing protein n=1 Tax=Streptococcus oralis TaxID=1303 RepID=UPI0027D9CC20|nr:G5 domain-containing protein [Streptococcus oralis]
MSRRAQAVKDFTAAITAVESTKSKLIEKPKPIVVEKDETKVEVKAYKTIRRDNADLDKGTEKIVQEGKDGSITTVEHVVLVDGVETEREVVSTNKIDAVNQIIEVGTKKVVTPVKPVDPVKPADKTINNLEVSEKVQLPKTGTESNICSALGISLMAVTVLGLFLREKDIVRNKRR